MILRLLLGSVLAGACLFAAVAHAEGTPLKVASCPRIDALELERLLAIEFGTLGLDTTHVREISVVCSSERVQVLAHAAMGLPLRAEWSLAQSDRASTTRLLALRISELLATPPPTPAATAPASVPIAVPAAPESTPVHQRRFALSMTATARRHGQPKAWLLGASIAGLAPLLAQLQLRADLTVEAARAKTQYAEVAWQQWTGSLALLWCMRTTYVLVGVGPGVRGAWATLEAHDVSPSQQARRLSAPWLGAVLQGHMAVQARGPWQAVLALEGGLTALPVHGLLDKKQNVLSVDGAFVGAQLGVGYGW